MNPLDSISPAESALMLDLPLLFVTAVLSLSARSRRNIIFGISLPLDFAEGPLARAAMQRYRAIVLGIGVFTVLAVSTLELKHHGATAGIAGPMGLLILLAAALASRAQEASQLRPFSVSVPLTRTADLSPTSDYGSLFASLAAFVPLLAAAFWLRTHWLQIPERWPQHWNAAGQVNGWGIRTNSSVMAPLVLGTALLILLTLTIALLNYAPGADARQRRRLLPPLAAVAWLLVALFAAIALMPLMHPNGPMPILAATGIDLVAMFGIVLWLRNRSGLGSAKEAVTIENIPAYDGTPDSAWHMGIFYFNATDPAILVPKRLGFGWTLNFARPMAWFYLFLLVVLIAGARFLPRLL